MLFIFTTTLRLFNRSRQLHRGFQRCFSAYSNYCSGNPTGIPFPSILPYRVSQILFGPFIDHLSSSQLLSRVHSHVQRPINLQAKSTPSCVQLRRANAQVQQHPIQGLCRNPTHCTAIGTVINLHPIPKCCQTTGRRRNRTLVPIHPPQLTVRRTFS